MKKPIRPIHGKINNYAQVLDRIHVILNGGLDKGSLSNPGNLNNTHVFVTTPAVADTEFTIIHNLGRIPQGFNVVQKSASFDTYSSSVNLWSTTQIFAKSKGTNQPIIIEVY